MAHPRPRATARPFLIALVTGGLLLAGCVPGSDLPATCDDASVTVAATLVEERLEPATVEVCRGQQVTIQLTVERSAVFHLHGYDAELPAQEVRAGEDVTLTFEAVRAGQFPIEIHTSDGPAEAQVGTLVVHEG